MPGKQMSIDAELRAGHIDHDEARRRRAALARESQLFGSMDGAMKFVKGDAIAGIVMLAVNIVGGLVIGVLQRGMDVGDRRPHVHGAHHRRGAGGADPGAADLDVGRHHRHARRLGGGGRPPGPRHRHAGDGAARRRSRSRPGCSRCWRSSPGCRRSPFLTLAAVLGLVAWRLLRTARPRRPAAAAATAAAAGATPAGAGAGGARRGRGRCRRRC